MSFALNLDSETVSQAHPDEPLTISPDAPISEAFSLLSEHPQSCVLVCQNEAMVGIFTERDALRLMAQGADLSGPISSVMVEQVAHVSQADTVKKAIAVMSAGGYRQLPILDGDNRPSGVVRVAGILHYLVEHFPNVIYTLPPSPHHSTQQREGA